MAFTPEDGTGLADANALCDVAFADAYFAERGITAWAGDASVKAPALIRATDYIENRWGRRDRFKGLPQFPDTPQALSFPRLYIGHDGAVPEGVKKACAEYALRTLGGLPLAPDPVVQSNGQTVQSVRKKIGPLETETSYVSGGVALLKPYPAADMLIKPFVTAGGGLMRA